MKTITNLIPQNAFESDRLNLNILNKNDLNFIQELTNTKGWLKFIGDRGTATLEGTRKYIEKINDNPDCRFWCVTLKETSKPIGMITLIKRDYLDHPDIGFAFLPEFAKKGYAFEASKIVLDEVLNHPDVSCICGITDKENSSSIKLLKKLGLTNHSSIKADGETLEMYFM